MIFAFLMMSAVIKLSVIDHVVIVGMLKSKVR